MDVLNFQVGEKPNPGRGGGLLEAAAAVPVQGSAAELSLLQRPVGAPVRTEIHKGVSRNEKFRISDSSVTNTCIPTLQSVQIPH